MGANGVSERRVRPRVLVVDDVEFNRGLISAVLAAADFDVDVACDGSEVCEAAANVAYDLILMDIEMPGMNGFEATARIRASQGRLQDIPIVALTSTRRRDARELSVRSGMDAYLERPIKAGALVSQVSRVLAEQPVRPRPASNTIPVWAFGVFSDLAAQFGHEKTEHYLASLAGLLRSMAFSIDNGVVSTRSVAKQVHDLRSVSGLLGFEEVSSLCADAEDAHRRALDVDHVPDLLRGIERAVEAIDAFRRDGFCQGGRPGRNDRACVQNPS